MSMAAFSHFASVVTAATRFVSHLSESTNYNYTFKLVQEIVLLRAEKMAEKKLKIGERKEEECEGEKRKKKVTSENNWSPPSHGDSNAGFIGGDEGCADEGEEAENLRKEDGDVGLVWSSDFAFVWCIAQTMDCNIYIGSIWHSNSKFLIFHTYFLVF